MTLIPVSSLKQKNKAKTVNNTYTTKMLIMPLPPITNAIVFIVTNFKFEN